MVVKENVSNLEITLKPSSSLEEVVVTAFGATQRKISLVGAVTTVAPNELQVPATSMASILGGRVAGIINLQQSGEPGQNLSEFWVRGIGTFGANASALVLIDGLEGDLNSIDPADVESFSVLKDASATAVYGVRGANGVVLVTTKRGVISPLKIMARANATFSTLTKMPEYLRAYEYASLLNEALEVRGAVPRYTNREMAIIQYGLDRDIYPDVDWQNEVMKDWGLQHTYYLSGQGGGDIAKYFVSLNMSNENSAYKMAPDSRYSSGVGYNTYSFRMNLDLKLTSTTNLYFGTDAYLTHRREPGLANTDYIWLAQAQLTPLLMPTVYSTGELPAYGPNGGISPYVIINHTGNVTKQTFTGKMTMSINQDLKFLPDGLKVRVQAAYDNKSYFDDETISITLTNDMKEKEEIDLEGAKGTVTRMILPGKHLGVSPVISAKFKHDELVQMIQGGIYTPGTDTEPAMYEPPTSQAGGSPLVTLDVFAPLYGDGNSKKEQAIGMERRLFWSCSGNEGDAPMETKAWATFTYNLNATEYTDENGVLHASEKRFEYDFNQFELLKIYDV